MCSAKEQLLGYRYLLCVGDVVGVPASVEEVYVPARRSCWNRMSRFDAAIHSHGGAVRRMG
jgi:hypothetical protein